MDYKLIGKKIRNERKKQNLTIEELAELSDISPNFLGKIERAQSIMSLDTLVKIVNALNISTDDILSHEVTSVSVTQVEKLSKKILEVSDINKKECVEIVELIVQYFSDKQ